MSKISNEVPQKAQAQTTPVKQGYSQQKNVPGSNLANSNEAAKSKPTNKFSEDVQTKPKQDSHRTTSSRSGAINSNTKPSESSGTKPEVKTAGAGLKKNTIKEEEPVSKAASSRLSQNSRRESQVEDKLRTDASEAEDEEIGVDSDSVKNSNMKKSSKPENLSSSKNFKSEKDGKNAEEDSTIKNPPKKSTMKSSKLLNQTNKDMRECVYKLNVLLENSRDVEEKKIDLALRFDFIAAEIFKIIDKQESGLISTELLAPFLKSGRIWNDEETVQALVSKHDKDKDGSLNFKEFFDMIAPYSEEYRRSLADRKSRGISSYSDYTLQTRKALKVVVAALFDNLDSLSIPREQKKSIEEDDASQVGGSQQESVASQEETVQQIQDVINQLYEQLKERYDGDEISMNDIADELAEYGLNSTFRELCVLFTNLNLNLDGKLNTEEYRETEEAHSNLDHESVKEEVPEHDDVSEKHSRVSASQKSRLSGVATSQQDELNSKRSVRSQHQSRISEHQDHHDSELDDGAE